MRVIAYLMVCLGCLLSGYDIGMIRGDRWYAAHPPRVATYYALFPKVQATWNGTTYECAAGLEASGSWNSKTGKTDEIPLCIPIGYVRDYHSDVLHRWTNQ